MSPSSDVHARGGLPAAFLRAGTPSFVELATAVAPDVLPTASSAGSGTASVTRLSARMPWKPMRAAAVPRAMPASWMSPISHV